MDTVKKFISNNFKVIGFGLCAAGVSAVAVNKLWPVKRKERVCGEDYPKDTVIVHQFNKGDFAPSLGHFVIKLETYLRIAKIPYQPEYGADMGPKNKLPWIEYNGVTMGDSQLIINFLNEKFNVNLNKGMSKEQRAVAWAIQKWIEEFTYHLNVYTKWCLFPEEFLKYIPTMPVYMRRTWFAYVPKWQYFVGTARHTAQEVHDMITFDLRQLANVIGDRKFIMGGDKPTEVDCAVFGVLTEVRWHTPDSCPGVQVLKKELPSLMTYIDRMKQLYWPDWDDKITGGKQEEIATGSNRPPKEIKT